MSLARAKASNAAHDMEKPDSVNRGVPPLISVRPVMVPETGAPSPTGAKFSPVETADKASAARLEIDSRRDNGNGFVVKILSDLK